MFPYDAPSSNRDSSSLRYLENIVRTAPPARLRLMLLERAVGLCASIATRWRDARPDVGFDEQTLHLRDILTELLSGVGKSEVPVVIAVSDLYVFLCKHLTDAEMLGDVTMIDEIGLVLQIETETWRIVCETTKMQMQSPITKPHFTGSTPGANATSGQTRSAGFSLNG